MNKNTKIVCTLGPSSDSTSVLERMLEAGMNVARLNFSHGSYEHMGKIIGNIREASRATGKPVAILQDLQGPKIRVGELPKEGVVLGHGEEIILSTSVMVSSSSVRLSSVEAGSNHGSTLRQAQGDTKATPIIPIQYRHLHRDVKVGDSILLDDGYMEVTVTRVQGEHIFCTVKTGGILKSHKGINCPTASISAKTITPKDREDLAFGLKNGIDFVALSFVKSADDIHELRHLLAQHHHSEVQIIAKIERHEAIKNLDSIAQTADGLMVARGDLGIEIPAEQVPIAQKEIVRLGLLYGKPVIIATQILESMIHNPRATRAEISDAATAIFDHADAFMLSGETSVGKYPVQAVRTLAKVAHATEHELRKKEYLLSNPFHNVEMPISDATCCNAARIAEDIRAEAIVVITKGGYTARQIAKHRPRTPIIAVTHDERVKRQLGLVWGINTILLTKQRLDSDITAARAIQNLLKKHNLVDHGKEVVIVNAGKRNNFITTVVL